MSRTSRTAFALSMVGLLALGALGPPATAADEPDWTDVAGYPKILDADGDGLEDVGILWQEATTTLSPFTNWFGGYQVQEPLRILRPEVAIDEGPTRYFGFGMDLGVQGDIAHLWDPDSWGEMGVFMGEDGYGPLFWFELESGESLSTSIEDSEVADDARAWQEGTPAWSGHSLAVFELSEAPTGGVVPDATLLDTLVIPGRFVPVNLDAFDENTFPSLVLGERLTVDGGGGSPEIFPGLSATVTATDLTPGEDLELWLARNLDYFLFSVAGGGLPATAVPVGTGTVAADGTLTATINVPSDLQFGPYQLVAGNPAERYWPAGTWQDFTVTAASNAATEPTAAGLDTTIDLSLGNTSASLTFASVTSAGDTTVSVSATGPQPDGFRLASNPPVYYHVATTAGFDGLVTVCIDYDPGNIPYPPHLYHFDNALDRWIDITTSVTNGQVCGETTSFSPFTIGHPPFDFSGFLPPVSVVAGEENLVKAGQSIPVKFSLGGDHGLDVVESAQFVYESTAPSGSDGNQIAPEAGSTGLSYDAENDQYKYLWKTSKSWAGKSGQFVLTLVDDSVHTFEVTFK